MEPGKLGCLLITLCVLLGIFLLGITLAAVFLSGLAAGGWFVLGLLFGGGYAALICITLIGAMNGFD